MHEHFRTDADGELVPCAAPEATHTVVTREAEWDDSSRARTMQFDAHLRSIDKSTGLPLEDAYTDQGFLIYSDAVNYAERAIDRQRAIDEKRLKEDGSADVDAWFKHRTYYAKVYVPSDPD